MNMVALIPARAGSKRIPGKNTKLLGGHPLIAYTIAAAQQSGVFSDVWCSTEDMATGDLASRYGAQFIVRGAQYAQDDSPDIDWIAQFLRAMGRDNRPYAFAILRPTSPFRTAATIRRAFYEFTTSDGTHDSLRAVEPVTQNPYKMWTWQGAGYPIKPLLEGTSNGVPLHSCPSQVAPKVYIQNSSLEMGYTSNVETHGSIAGRKIVPFFTRGWEGFSADEPGDFERAEAAIAAGSAILPELSLATVPADSPA